jgi:serine protease Do
MKKYLPIAGISAGTALVTALICLALFGPNPHPEVLRGPGQRAAGTNVGPRGMGQLAGFGHGGDGDLADFRLAAEIATPSVVHIKGEVEVRNRFGFNFGEGGSTGSGVVYSTDGYVITNNHVVEEATTIEVTFHDGRTFPATIVGRDPSTDLALLQVKELDGYELKPIEITNSSQIQVGDWVLAVGNPFNLTSTVTAGIVSAKGRNIDILEGEYSIESFIQTDAAVNPGNSGGALVDPSGRLVGINTAIMTRSGRYEGYSFAVPSNLVRKVVTDLKEFGEVQRGFLGVYIQNVDNRIAREIGLPNLEGVYLERVKPGEAAAEAGLQDGDVILRVNGNKLKTHPELQEYVGQFRPGDKLDVEYFRGGKSYQTTVVLRNSSNTTTLGVRRDDRPQTPDEALLRRLGMELRELTADESRRLAEKGVVVAHIREGSVISKTNMEPGFIITKVDESPVKKPTDVLRLLQRPGRTVTLEGYYEEYLDQGYFSYVFEK